MKALLNHAVLSVLLLLLCSCAQEPDAVVKGISGIIQDGDLNPSTSTSLNAVIFEGTDLEGKDCTVSLSSSEVDGKKLYLAKVDYALHGEKMPDIVTSLYRFDINTNTYSDANSGAGNVTFAGAILNNDTTPDLNQLSDYETQASLIYSLRVETRASSAADYEEALAKVVQDPTEFSAYSSTLDQILMVVFKKAHVDHYDAAGCVGMKAIEVKEITFEL